MNAELSGTYKAILDASPDAIVVVDYYGIIVMVNDRVEEMFGYKKSELLDSSVEALIPHRFAKSHQHHRQEYSNNPTDRKIHEGKALMALKKDGSEFQVEISLKPVKSNKKTLMVAFIRDVTVKKTTEFRFQKMIEDVQDYSILFTDIEGNITNWNKGVLRIKGYSGEEIVGKNFRIFFTPEDQKNKKPEKLLEKALKEGRAEEECWRVKKDGSIYWAFVSITAILDDMNNFIGFSKMTKDLTQNKMAYEVLKKQSDELKIKNKELEHFAYIASHDLQEPLSTLTSMIDLIREEEGLKHNQETETYFSFMEEAVVRMRCLVKDLLDYSRLGRNRKLNETDINLLLQDVQKDLKNRIQSINAVIEVGEMPVLRAFDVELRLVFQNLLGNALKFIKPGVVPRIEVRVEDIGRYWKFSIKDNGIGIKEKHLGKVFTIFQRLNNRGTYEGTGIGLAHCKKVVEIHEGTMWVNSVFNKGSIFYFTIPKQVRDEIEEELMTTA